MTSYAWNFGDGSKVTTASPTVTHTYTSPGVYTATLTVTDSAGTSTTEVFTGQTMSRNGGPSATTSHQVVVGGAATAGAVLAATSDGGGYWIAGPDGGVFSYGDAIFHGSLVGRVVPNTPIVGMAATPDDGGYWLVGADGGVFALGDAGYFGSMGGTHLNAPIVGMAATRRREGLLAGRIGRRGLCLRRRGLSRVHGRQAPQQPGGRHGRDG